MGWFATLIPCPTSAALQMTQMETAYVMGMKSKDAPTQVHATTMKMVLVHML